MIFNGISRVSKLTPAKLKTFMRMAGARSDIVGLI